MSTQKDTACPDAGARNNGIRSSSLLSQVSRSFAVSIVDHVYVLLCFYSPHTVYLLQFSTVKMKLVIFASLLSAAAAFTAQPLKTAVSYFHCYSLFARI
jgi:hypothetical protein